MSPPLFLLAFANDHEDTTHYLRNLPKELRQITEALDQASAADLCEYITIPNATLKQILDTFQKAANRNRITVFHYAGHADSFQLLLESDEGRSAVVDARGLAAFLSLQRSLKLVFLNGCSTQPQVDALLDANIPTVIATSQVIDDAVAMDFASRFYSGLAGGANIQSAYEEAAAAARTASDGTTRNLYWVGARSNGIAEGRWPWELRFMKGAETEGGHWNLPEAVGNPLFGVPGIPERYLPNEPFRHLTWFTREHAEIFFGRNYEIRQLYDRLTEPNGAPIVLLYGQAGVGKSSLLDAGLIPRLESSHDVLYLRRNQDLGLRQTVLQGLKHGDALGPAWRMHEQQANKPLVLILDQVEELFTRPNKTLADELQDFLNDLEETFALPQSRPLGRLILGFRKEWESEIEQKLKQHNLPHAKVFLESLNRQSMIQAITGITNRPRLQHQYGLTIEAGVPEIIADDLASDPDSPVAPTLQILLTKMWAEAKKVSDSRPTFTLKLYQQLRKEGILLGDFLDQQLAQVKVSHPETVNSGLALDVLAYHTTPLGTAAQRSDAETRAEYSHQTSVLATLIDKLKELYLIADPPHDQKDETAKATRLAHDTIAPIVRARFDKSVLPGQRARRVLENRSPDWQGKNVGVALDERDLSTVEKGASGMRTWTADEQRLIDASRSLRDRRQRTNKIVKIAGVVGLVAIALASVFAWWQREKAKEAEVKAVSRQLAAQADSLAAGPADLLMRRVLLAIEANRHDVSGESINALHSSLALLPLRKGRFKHDGPVGVTQFSPDGKLLATGSEDKTARLWNLADGKELAHVTHKYPVSSVVFSLDGRYFISGSGAGKDGEQKYGQVKAWDSQNKTELTVAEDLHDRVVKLAFVLETYSVVIQTLYGVQVVSLANGQPKVTSELNANLWRGVLSPDARYVAYQDNLVIHIADLTKKSPDVSFVLTPNLGNRDLHLETMTKERRALAEKGMMENQVDLMAFSNDGRYLAIATPDQLVHIWDWLQRKEIFRRKDPQIGRLFKSTPFTLTFSRDNKYLAYIGRTQNARLWDATGQDIWNQLFNDENDFADIQFLDSSRLLFVSNHAVRMFHMPSAENKSGPSRVEEELRVVPDVSILGAALAPDGQRLAVADKSGWASIWDLRPIRDEKIFEGGFSVWYSPSGRYRLEYGFGGMKIFDSATDKLISDCSLVSMQGIIAMSDDLVAVSGIAGSVKVCELATGHVVREFSMNSGVRNMAFLPSHRALLVINRDSSHPKELNLGHGSQKELSNIDVNNESHFSFNGKYVATMRNHGDPSTASYRTSFEVVEVDTGRRTANLDAADVSYTYPVFSHNGEYVAARKRRADSSELAVWSSLTGQELKSLTVTPIAGYMFSDDSKYLVAPNGTSVQILDLQTHEVNTIQTLIPAQRAVLSRDSKHLLISSEDRMLQVWNIADKTREFSLQLELASVDDIQMSPDRKYLIVTGDLIPHDPQKESTESKPQIHFLLWQSEDLIKQACTRATRNLTESEWKDYLPNESYRKTCPNID